MLNKIKQDDDIIQSGALESTLARIVKIGLFGEMTLSEITMTRLSWPCEDLGPELLREEE